MSTSPVLVALYLGFDPMLLAPQDRPAAQEILNRIASRIGEQAIYVQADANALILGAHAETVIDTLIEYHALLMKKSFRPALRGALTSATLSVTAAGKTMTQRSVESVKEMVKVVEPGGIFIANRLLAIIDFYSPRHAVCFTEGKSVDTSIGPLTEFAPPELISNEAENTPALSGFTRLMPPPGRLRDELMRQSEKLLIHQIGPLASLLVKRSNALAQNWTEFVFMLTVDLQAEMKSQIQTDLNRIWESCHKKSERS